MSTAAHASFGGAPCRDFACHFETWALLLGAVGAPNSALLFVVLHLVFRHPARSKLRQFFLGGFIGVVAFELAATAAAQFAAWDLNPFLGFVPVYLLLASLSWVYVREPPRVKAAA